MRMGRRTPIRSGVHEMLTAMSPPSWYPNEVALAGRENLDLEHVARFDGKMDSNAAAEVSLLKDLGLTERSALIEFGDGTGQFTVAAARDCAQVTTVDVSPPMLEYLLKKLTSHGLTNVNLVNAGFLNYTHTAGAADFVYSRYALHHLSDFWKAIALQPMRAMMPPVESAAYGRSSTTLTRRKPPSASRRGALKEETASTENRPVKSSKNISATNTRPSAGSSNQ